MAAKAQVPVDSIKRVTIWGNHSSTQYPDAFHAEIAGQPAPQVIDDDAWIRETFIPLIQRRGSAIIEARGLKQVTDAGAIERLVDEAIAASPQQVEQFRAGKQKVLGFFVGQVMKASKGKANPGQVNALLRKKLSGS